MRYSMNAIYSKTFREHKSFFKDHLFKDMEIESELMDVYGIEKILRSAEEEYFSSKEVPLYDHIDRRDEYIQAAIDFSEKNEITVRIYEFEKDIYVNYQIELIVYLNELPKVLKMSDHIIFKTSDISERYVELLCQYKQYIRIAKNGERIF